MPMYDFDLIPKHLERLYGGSSRFHVEYTYPHHEGGIRFPFDIHHVASSSERSFELLITNGMSRSALSVPEDKKDRNQWLRIELCMLLPANWPLDDEMWTRAEKGWPSMLLADLSAWAHWNRTWLEPGHFLPNGEPPQPYFQGLDKCGVEILKPWEELFYVSDDPPLHILWVLTLTAAEVKFRKDAGHDALLDKLEKIFPNLQDLIDPARPSVVD